MFALVGTDWMVVLKGFKFTRWKTTREGQYEQQVLPAVVVAGVGL